MTKHKQHCRGLWRLLAEAKLNYHKFFEAKELSQVQSRLLRSCKSLPFCLSYSGISTCVTDSTLETVNALTACGWKMESGIQCTAVASAAMLYAKGQNAYSAHSGI
jgi:hypothetical protein